MWTLQPLQVRLPLLIYGVAEASDAALSLGRRRRLFPCRSRLRCVLRPGCPQSHPHQTARATVHWQLPAGQRNC